MKSTTRVLFRFDKKHKEVVAILWDEGEPTFNVRGYAVSYAHLGQHGACRVSWYINCTRAAKPAEYIALKR